MESGIRSNWDTLNHGICDSSEGKSVMYKQFTWLLWESPTSLHFFIMRLMYIYIYIQYKASHNLTVIYSYILSYVYYIHIAHKYNIPFSVSNGMSPTCPLVYIHTIQYIYICKYFWIFYEHINLRCTHVYIHNYIYLSIYIHFFIFFCGPACNFSLKLPRPLKRQARWRSGHWAGFDWFKRWAVGINWLGNSWVVVDG